MGRKNDDTGSSSSSSYSGPSRTRNETRAPPRQRQWPMTQWQTALPILIHILSIILYLRPLTSQPHLMSSPPAVLDEAHIVSSANADVSGTSSIPHDVFRNDYWGRPMNSPSSHKSWRPLTVLSFRWLKGGRGYLFRSFGWSELFVHRLVNVILHSAVSEMASVASVRLFPDLDPTRSLLTRCMTKLLFALHPAHVEVVANAANRPHIIAVLMSALMLDPSTNVLVVIVATVVGLLSSETAVFQLPAVLATMTVIRWKERGRVGGVGDPKRPQIRTFRSFLSTMVELLPRYVVIIILGIAYLSGRKFYDTLSIPDGLIRPAENPFYELEGLTRILTYALLLTIHVGKAILINPIGFSHEYGFECIRNVVSPMDVRLLGPALVYVMVGFITLQCAARGLEPTLNWAVCLSWLLTLFPVSGVVKVGTSIADRIVVATTFAFAVYGGRFLAGFVLDFGNGFLIGADDGGGGGGGGGSGGRKEKKTAAGRHTTSSRSTDRRVWTAVKAAWVAVAFGGLWSRTDRRSREWMDSMTLLESSLVSCPRSAKSNLEISKIYSGLYPDKFDLDKAISFLEKAEEIDSNYCDAHLQFAHCYIQQGRYLEFEERLTKAVMCPFSMGGAVPLWQRYWKQVTSDPRTGEQAKQRMDTYQAIINEAIEREVAKEGQAEKNKKRKASANRGEL